MAQLLINLGQVSDPLASGTANVWPVSVDTELNTPDNVVTLTNTEPQQQGRFQGSGQMNELWTFQAKIRAADSQTAYAKANALSVLFDQVIYKNQVTLAPTSHSAGGTYRVGRVTRKSGPIAIGREGSATKRYIYTINAIVDIIQLS